MPAPRLPPFNIIQTVLGDAISIAIVTYIFQISIAKMFAKKNNYAISPNQVNLFLWLAVADIFLTAKFAAQNWLQNFPLCYFIIYLSTLKTIFRLNFVH
ncbi:MAG: SulP family inorganic anion transporter [Selenomonadaceae bacterium]